MKRSAVRSAASLLLVAGAAVAVAQPAHSAPPEPVAAGPFELTLPAGWACSDFDLLVEGAGDARLKLKTLTDADGNLRTIQAGTGDTLTFTNLTNGESRTFRSNGSVSRVQHHEDGTQTTTTTGHNVLILFPSDIPAGPSTQLIVGRTVFTVDVAGNYDVLSTSGDVTDICAALS
ncbi:hypothetical protein [Georgenia muralis]